MSYASHVEDIDLDSIAGGTNGTSQKGNSWSAWSPTGRRSKNRSKQSSSHLYGGLDNFANAVDDPINPNHELVKGPDIYCSCCCRQCQCLSRRNCVTIVILLILAHLGILLSFMYYVIAPIIVQQTVDQAELTFETLTLTNPLNTSVRMVAHCMMTGTEGYTGSMEPTTFQIYYDSASLGYVASTTRISFSGDNGAAFVMNETMVITNSTVFNHFSERMMASPSVFMRMTGTISVSVIVGGVKLSFDGINFNKQMEFSGFEGLRNVTIVSFDMVLENNTAIVKINADIFNPSIVSISPLGSLSLDMYYDNALIGSASVPDTSMNVGHNGVSMFAILSSSANQTILNDLFTRFLAGEPSFIEARGTMNRITSSIPLYNPLMTSFKLLTTLVGARLELPIQASMKVKPVQLIIELLTRGNATVPTSLLLINPFGAPVIIHAVSLDIYYNNTRLGFANTNKDSTGAPLSITIPANSSTWSTFVDVTMDARGSGSATELIRSMVAAIGDGIVFLGIEGSMRVSVGDLYLNPGYSQPENIATCISTKVAKCVNHTRDYYPNVNPPPMPPSLSLSSGAVRATSINDGVNDGVMAVPRAAVAITFAP